MCEEQAEWYLDIIQDSIKVLLSLTLIRSQSIASDLTDFGSPALWKNDKKRVGYLRDKETFIVFCVAISS